MNKKKSFNDEIDLFELIINMMDQKFKAIIITLAFIILGNVYYFLSDKSLIAETYIKPISIFEIQKYNKYNKLAGGNSTKFDTYYFYDLFINKIQSENLIEEAIIKFEIINKVKFQNEREFKDETQKIASLIKENITAANQDKANENNDYWKIKFKINDKNKWKDFLIYIENKTNEEIRLSLLSQFDEEIMISKQILKYELENIEQDIANAIDDYQIATSNNLVFLKEQAEIARTLNIKRNSLEVANFSIDNTVINNIKSPSFTSQGSYYLKGYEMIEKEIDIISSRKNNKAFNPKLIELESNKRSILQNKEIERLEFIFSGTPIINKNAFKAAEIEYLSTNYLTQISLFKVLSISFLIGLLISFIVITINIAKNSRK